MGRSRPAIVNRDVPALLETANHPAMADIDFCEYRPRLEPGMVMRLTIQEPWDEPVHSD